MSDYIANCPISTPINIPGLKPDVDFNGMMFSYEMGPMYMTSVDEVSLRPPHE